MARYFCRWRLAGVCLRLGFAALLAMPGPSSVQADPGEQADAADAYDGLIREAVREFDLGNFEEARALFARAHAISPNARTHRGLGFVEFELRNYGECIRQLEAALASQVKPLDTRLRRDTQQVLDRARRYVARVHVESEPSAAQVLVDGVPVEVPEGEAITLRVGDHVLEFRAAGYVPEKRRLSLTGGEETTVSVVLAQATAGPANAVSATEVSEAIASRSTAGSVGAVEREPADQLKPARARIWTWTLAGTAVGLGIVGLGFQLKVNSASDSVRSECARAACTDADVALLREGVHLDRWRALRTTSFALAGGVAAGAVAAYFLERRRPSSRGDGGLAWSLSLGAQHASVRCFGVF